MAYKRKLIEVAIPLAAINAAAETDGPKRKGHPWRLHYWWARRKLVVARAVLFAQIVDDPSSREEEFRRDASESGTSDIEAAVQRRIVKERDRLFDLIVRMVDRRNIDDKALFDEVRSEIARSTGGNPPVILDPFAGGGTIPLEAQRLGLEAHASDLNPVAVLINKALIEIPSKFTGQPPVFPGAAGQRNGWPRATGLAEDVRRYGAWVRGFVKRGSSGSAIFIHLQPRMTAPNQLRLPGFGLARSPVQTPLVQSRCLSCALGGWEGKRAKRLSWCHV